MNDVTRILSAVEQGDAGAAEQLLPLVYDELRKLAAQKLAREEPGQTLQATALVHEAYLRLVDDQKGHTWESLRHFFGAAAEAMRRILIERARRRRTGKHGGGRLRVDLTQVDIPDSSPQDQLLELDDALCRLANEEPEAAQLVKLRLFAGLSVDQAGEALGLSRANAYRQWTYARAWLHSRLQDPSPPTRE
jgi:RNA polymerase sigma factor (TIGR02999 family)